MGILSPVLYVPSRCFSCQYVFLYSFFIANLHSDADRETLLSDTAYGPLILLCILTVILKLSSLDCSLPQKERH